MLCPASGTGVSETATYDEKSAAPYTAFICREKQLLCVGSDQLASLLRGAGVSETATYDERSAAGSDFLAKVRRKMLLLGNVPNCFIAKWCTTTAFPRKTKRLQAL